MNNKTIPKVAVIVTEYRYNSHADVILGRLLGDLGYVPSVDVVSIYTDQVPANDMSREAAARCGIRICSTIGEAVKAEHAGGPVDGVILIGEHGDYPTNEKGQMLYPRRRFLEETIAALDELGLIVPIFSDKHLAYNLEDALWMYHAMKSRDIPFLGGSSIPHTDPVPAYDPRLLQTAREFLVVSYSDGFESYGFHGADVLQSIAEQRSGEESGIASVHTIAGESAAWAAMDRGEWPSELLLEALATYSDLQVAPPPDPEPASTFVAARERESDPILVALRELEPSPILVTVHYADGARGYMIQFRRLVEQWAYAFRDDEGRIVAARCNSDNDRPFAHFERLTRMIETMIITRKPPFPMERTFFSTGIIYYAVESLYSGRKLDTPELHVPYQSIASGGD